jgi:hypothetical protein
VEEEGEDTPQPPAPAANHKRGIPDMTTHSELEQEHEQEHPAARRSGRRAGATELEVLDIEGKEEAQETPKGGGSLIPARSGNPVVPQETYCSSS